MLPRRLTVTWLALASTLLIACGGPNHTDSDSLTTEMSGTSETSAGTSEETDTGSESDGECAFDGSDAVADAQAQPLVLTNSGATAMFVYPAGCSHHAVLVDGVRHTLGTRFPCSNVVINPPCYDGCDGDFVTPPIRVDPGASFDWPFPGYVWEHTAIPTSCRPECFEPEVGACGIGHVVDEGTLVELEIRVTAECDFGDPDTGVCECPPGEAACELEATNSINIDLGPSTDVPISFTHGSPDPVIVDLAG